MTAAERWPVLVTRRLPLPVMDLLFKRCDVDLWEGPPEAIPRAAASRSSISAVSAIATPVRWP